MTLLLLLGAIFASRKLSQLVSQDNVAEDKQIIVIDAGHGGEDPGKVGVNGELEKDINLQIAQKVKALLEQQGIEVLMTRQDDSALDSKLEDMKQRVTLINETKPVLAVSIHQNSYSDSSVRGAQVFYYTDSEVSKEAALMMQEELKQMDTAHAREAKGNNTFYMLKKTNVPIIIVECGFLSNPEEAKLLTTEEYQDKIAQVISTGIVKWIQQM